MTDTPFDLAALSAKHTEQSSARRVRRRHRAGLRLRICGIMAIGLAIAALIVLMYTIFVNAASVLTERYIAVDVKLDLPPAAIARFRDDNATAADEKADISSFYGALGPSIMAGLKNAVGGEVNPRYENRLLELLSFNAPKVTTAEVDLVERVRAEPHLIGKSVRVRALLDDTAQLFFTGRYGPREDAGSVGTLKIDRKRSSRRRVTLILDPAALSAARARLREVRAGQAAYIRGDEVKRQRFAVGVATTRVADTSLPEKERERWKRRLDGYRQNLKAASAKADALDRQATDRAAVFRIARTDPSILIRLNGGWIKLRELGPERAVGRVLAPLRSMDDVRQTEWRSYLLGSEADRKFFNDRKVMWMTDLELQGKIESRANWRLVTAPDSTVPELAGAWGAIAGSFWTMMVTFFLAFPIGVMASIYLEEFAPRNRLTNFVEVNINNLAAVPSIVFGLLGLTVLLSGVQLFGSEIFDGLLKAFADDPRSTPLVGGVVLALMSLPTIIIASRASIRAVPPSIRDAALALGASRLQTSTHHVLPLAMPGILTGSIIAMAQALGETAPLIIVGMNNFAQDVPGGPMDKANVLPSLIYLWNNNSEVLYEGKTAAAISILLIFLIVMNALAVLLRKRFERRW